MSGINGFNLDYSSLFNNVGGASSSNYTYNLGGTQQASSSSFYGYGVNNSTLTEEQVQSILDFKNAAGTLQNALSALMSKKNDGSSIFGAYSANSSDTDALTASYNNNIGKYSSEALEARRDPSYKPSAPENVSVRVQQLAQTQKNTGASLSNGEMELEKNQTYRFEISNGGETTEIAFVTEDGDTNESTLDKIAKAINDKNIGVKASVIYDAESKTSRLSLESRETGIDDGDERAFTITDKSGYDAVEKLGLDNMTQEAQNARFFVKDAEGSVDYRESKSNNVELTDRTSATLKKTTSDYVSISFSSNSTEGINAVRELVNGFNALYDAASGGSTIHSSRLANQLQGLADTYQNQLSEVGITRNADGYFEIDEDKMKSAAESGALQNLFNPSESGNSYGFAQRLGNIANTVADNPNQYAVSSNQTANSSSEGFWDELSNGPSGSYSKLYFNLLRYENMGSLFNSMF